MSSENGSDDSNTSFSSGSNRDPVILGGGEGGGGGGGGPHVAGLVLARGGSEGIPLKNLAPLGPERR